MKLRIYHIINVPNEPFYFDVPDVKTAIQALRAIAQYDFFLGDGKITPWKTVGQRMKKRAELSNGSRFLRRMFERYDKYQLNMFLGGVPFVESNVQGCEIFESTEDSEGWTEYYDEDGNDIREIERFGNRKF